MTVILSHILFFRELKLKSFEWFYNNVSQKFKRFGSAKVVRSLYKQRGARGRAYHSKYYISNGRTKKGGEVPSSVDVTHSSPSLQVKGLWSTPIPGDFGAGIGSNTFLFYLVLAVMWLN